ncbi:unnamed protein product [Heterobilharzia americana]|nr:unnamed protein product [Heterobilharzia americana]
MAYNISVPDAYKYRAIFDQLQPTYGKLPGIKIREVFLKSRLPIETLGKIWDLADIDNDGSLDQSEFIVAMHLVHRSLRVKSYRTSFLKIWFLRTKNVTCQIISLIIPYFALHQLPVKLILIWHWSLFNLPANRVQD